MKATETAGGVGEALAAAVDALAAAGVETPRLDAELLLSEATGWDRAALAADPGRGVPAPAARCFGEMVRRRLRREPVAYIVGRRGFRSIELAVDGRVLVPRPETELLVELALELRPASVLDVGTGCGAVALAIADELPDCEVTGTDSSAAALEVARANAEALGLAGRVAFVHGSVPERAFDLLVANLPYVAEPDWPSLQPEVNEWEPRGALLAGPDGLDAIRALLTALSPGCRISFEGVDGNTTSGGGGEAVALEVGAGQADAVAAMLAEAGFGAIERRRDLAGIERVVWGARAR
ncbi:MAG TPA: peptide chain release factor N(5)-glutamine methyltransferase [Solirubrobacterales bacterium]